MPDLDIENASRPVLIAAVRAGLALADEWESTADAYRHAAEGSYDAGARNAYRHHAGDLRAALTGPLGHDTDNGGGCDA